MTSVCNNYKFYLSERYWTNLVSTLKVHNINAKNKVQKHISETDFGVIFI